MHLMSSDGLGVLAVIVPTFNSAFAAHVIARFRHAGVDSVDLPYTVDDNQQVNFRLCFRAGHGSAPHMMGLPHQVAKRLLNFQPFSFKHGSPSEIVITDI